VTKMVRVHSINMDITTVLPCLLIFSIIACNSGKKENAVNIQWHGKITLVDSTTIADDLLDFNDTAAYYPLYYIGKMHDTIYLGHKPVSMYANEALYAKYDHANNWAMSAARNMSIVVDTSLAVAHTTDFSHLEEDNQTVTLDSTKNYAAFPVFITNLSDSLLNIGNHNFVHWTIREAKNKSGQWHSIENRITDLCGTAKRELVLEPGDIAVAKLLRYKGKFKTECRLKFNWRNATVYSNSFFDYIDERQL